MPGHIQWMNDEKTIISHIYEGVVTLEDYYAVIDRHYEMSSGQDHVVHSIMDRSGIKKSPASLSAVMRYANKKVPPNQGIRVVVGGQMLTKVLVNNIGKVIAPSLTKDVYFADNVEAAMALIEQKAHTFK